MLHQENCCRCQGELVRPHMLQEKYVCGNCFALYEKKKIDLLHQYTNELVTWAKSFLQISITEDGAPMQTKSDALPDILDDSDLPEELEATRIQPKAPFGLDFIE